MMMYAMEHGELAPLAYRNASQLLFRSNRTLTAVDADDLLYMCLQGDAAFQSGMAKIFDLFSSAQSDFASALRVVEDLIVRLAHYADSFTVVLEIVEFLYEPFFHHPQADKIALFKHAEEQLFNLAQRYRRLSNFARYGAAADVEDAHIEFLHQLLLACLEAARYRSRSAPVRRVLPIKVLYCAKKPILRG